MIEFNEYYFCIRRERAYVILKKSNNSDLTLSLAILQLLRTVTTDNNQCRLLVYVWPVWCLWKWDRIEWPWWWWWRWKEYQSTEDLATTKKKYFIGAIIQGTISKEQRVREIFKFSTLPNTTHTFNQEKSNRPQLNSFAFFFFFYGKHLRLNLHFHSSTN